MMKHDDHDRTHRHLKHALAAKPIDGATSFVDLIDSGMSSFNARQLSLACRLLARQLAAGDTRIGLSLSGALVPAGFGRSCLVPLIRSGFIDWVVSTGANLYHDLQMALGFEMFAGSPHADDTMLRDDGVIRIYDLYFKSEALYTTDAFIRDLFRQLSSEGKIGGKVSSSDVHEALGRELLRIDPHSGQFSVLAAAAEMGVPLHTSSPGDSGIGLNLAALYLDGIDVCAEPSIDVNETAAYVYQAKRTGGKSAVVILGGGSPKNFVLQTEPYIQEILGLEEAGHDFFIQFTDARPDTGGLSGATPSEAVSWGKIDPSKLAGTIVCYGDCSVYLPLLTRYLMEKIPARAPSRLWDKRREFCDAMTAQWRQTAARKP